MRKESSEHKRPLRSGYTTGACATAAAVATVKLLLSRQVADTVTVTLPKGRQVEFKLEYCRKVVPIDAQGSSEIQEYAQAAVRKDAGDDPDVTHNALVWCRLALSTTGETRFYAGSGVGIVTKAGLALAVGEPAINPIPRQMIVQHLQSIARQHQYSGGFDVTIGVVDGEALAQKTMNARLGILGGLSILGTTGIVKPFSCSAYIASIHQGIDVARANGIDHIAACTGSTSEIAVQNHYALADTAIIEMGDYVGAVVKHLRKHPVARLSLAAGFGKLTKLAAGHMNLHSNSSAIDFNWLGEIAVALGANQQTAKAIKGANTSDEVLSLCRQANIAIVESIMSFALAVLNDKLPASINVDVIAVDRRGNLL